MNGTPHETFGSLRKMGLTMGLLLATAFTQAHALSLTLRDQTTGATIAPNYKYIINEDNTGTTEQRSADPGSGCSAADAGYPATCNWVSMGVKKGSFAPIYTQGDQSNIAAVAPVNGQRYLISVLADGYKLDGTHFTGNGSADQAVTVDLISNAALPAATIQAEIFEDNAPTNSAPDVPAERGLEGWLGQITDYLGQVTTDVFGNPLCTEYDAGGNAITGTGGRCLSKCYVVSGGVDIGTVAADSNHRCPINTTGLTSTREGVPIPAGAVVEGKLKIPNLGPNRYALSATPPAGTRWVQTTTLEGNHDWDAWVMEGATGLDTEFVVAGEPFPAAFFGFVQPANNLAAGSGSITGVVDAVKVYVPTTGGLSLPGTIWGGLSGARIDQPIKKPWIALTDLNNGDRAVWVGQGDANGQFNISGVPAGSYTLTWWDEDQNYILDLVNVTVANGEAVNMGILPLTGWWTSIEGFVFNDLNRNGKKDPGEPGINGLPITMKKRENSVMDRGAIGETTHPHPVTGEPGYYKMVNTYPMTQWLVEEVYSDLYYTTGVTYQADNQPTETTVLGSGVDVNVLPIIGLGGRLDWGVHAYDALGASGGVDPRNGGIVGTVTYDTTRNELDPRLAVTEVWQPGIPDIAVNLYAPVPCHTTAGAACDPTNRYELASDGSYAKGLLLNQYITETWEQPTNRTDPSGCVARNVDGNPLTHSATGDEYVLPQTPGASCLEGPLMGVQFGPNAAGGSFGASVNGNYGFGDYCAAGVKLDTAGNVVWGADGTPECADNAAHISLSASDYLVQAVIPTDALGRPMYRATREEDVNIANGDTFVPQIPPPLCAGALHTVDVAGMGTDGYPENTTFIAGVTVPASTPVNNTTFPDIGGSPYEGQPKPLCDTKLITVSNGRSIAPNFNLFTDVPLPGRFWGLIVDDLNFSSNPKSLDVGEKAGVPFAPVGIYDYTNKLVATVESDYNGLFDVLLPSTNRISCPTPSGVCANLYRFVGNDPGAPGRLNPNYNPQFRTIAAEFEAFPGLLVPADLAPTQVGVTVQLPGGQPAQPVSCSLDTGTPQLFRVSQPYATRPSGSATVSVTIDGTGFGATRGSGSVTLGSTPLGIASWSDTRITANVTSTTPIGPQQLTITAGNGQKTVNGLTFHVLGTGYNPQVITVPAGSNLTNPHAIQNALDLAAQTTSNKLVVVMPGAPDPSNPRANPRGAYYENLIVHSPVKLQGVGPGSPDGSIRGSILDGSAASGDTQLMTDWFNKVASLSWVGTQTVYDGAVITLFAERTNQYGSAFRAAIDGFDIRGGNQQGFPTNINEIGGLPTGLPAGVVTQGGAIFANAYIHYLQISNNLVQNNGGAYGTIRIGTPNLEGTNANEGTDQHNDNLVIARNRVIANAGTNLAGGIGLFAGTSNYEVAYNDICGNFSAEYGGGITAYGLNYNGNSSYNQNNNFGGKIHDNRIYFNRSYDEGGGIMIAGQLPANPATLSPGSGPVAIYNNLIQANLANDDGGGIRFLQASSDCQPGPGYTACSIAVYNNFVVNNISTHEGGGISLNDAPNVAIYNNTVMKNITTATAVTSSGAPAPAGLSTSANSLQLRAVVPGTFSNPLLFNNIFWDNRAGARAVSTVTGIGLPGDPSAINYWDIGVADDTGLLSPTNSILWPNNGGHAYNVSATNRFTDPLVVAPYDVSVTFSPWRNNPAFIDALLVTAELLPNRMGNYHLQGIASSAFNSGAASSSSVSAPNFDIDNQPRPARGGVDMGADEVP